MNYTRGIAICFKIGRKAGCHLFLRFIYIIHFSMLSKFSGARNKGIPITALGQQCPKAAGAP